MERTNPGIKRVLTDNYYHTFFFAFCEMFDFTIILLQHIIQCLVHGYF